MCYVVSACLQQRIYSYEYTNITQKMINKIVSSWFLLFLFLKVCTLYFICCCSITNTVISLVAQKLHQIHMKKQVKFTTRWNKLEVRRANSQTILSYPVRFSTDIIFFFTLFCFLSSCYFLGSFWNSKYIFWHTFDYASGWVIKKLSSSWFPETRLLFWGPYV